MSQRRAVATSADNGAGAPEHPKRLTENGERTRVAWADTDAGGRIHHTAVFRYAEQAETSFLRNARLPWENGDFPRRRVEADFLKPLCFEDV